MTYAASVVCLESFGSGKNAELCSIASASRLSCGSFSLSRMARNRCWMCQSITQAKIDTKKYQFSRSQVIDPLPPSIGHAVNKSLVVTVLKRGLTYFANRANRRDWPNASVTARLAVAARVAQLMAVTKAVDRARGLIALMRRLGLRSRIRLRFWRNIANRAAASTGNASSSVTDLERLVDGAERALTSTKNQEGDNDESHRPNHITLTFPAKLNAVSAEAH